MSEFLKKILETKRQEVAALHKSGVLQTRLIRQTPSQFARAIRQGNALTIVAEVKKASPSKGLIQPDFDPVATARMYENIGAAAISVLTDESFFQGSIHDLNAVQEVVNVPVLRKDFVIDEVQVNEAVAAGADAILLICAALSPNRLEALAAYARESGLDVLVEVHSVDELEMAMRAEPSVLGINNRNLHSFAVDLATTEAIMPLVQSGVPVLAESGISSADDAQRMADTGVAGLLIGESLMRKAGTGLELQTFFQSLRPLRKQPTGDLLSGQRQ